MPIKFRAVIFFPLVHIRLNALNSIPNNDSSGLIFIDTMSPPLVKIGGILMITFPQNNKQRLMPTILVLFFSKESEKLGIIKSWVSFEKVNNSGYVIPTFEM